MEGFDALSGVEVGKRRKESNKPQKSRGEGRVLGMMVLLMRREPQSRKTRLKRKLISEVGHSTPGAGLRSLALGDVSILKHFTVTSPYSYKPSLVCGPLTHQELPSD